ncbi:inositol oxygenase-like [Xenia sp. Carnegie-2017]|uniref:inositol oxygenase-like n=1 Tax=Xenia sp. Carnegie-2017 TaxID=2897299 RepID=UPI001F04D93F|nr:inositol oxygenase-like [Xenia sp. Carnegie-2017]
MKDLLSHQVFIPDPSQLHRPETLYEEYNTLHQLKPVAKSLEDVGKDVETFRNYDVNDSMAYVRETYRKMHTEQTVEKGEQMRKEWLSLDHDEMTIMDAITLLDNLVDESDPDIDLPNSVHAFQTAERIREAHPDKDWFQLVGLIHDVGKVMALHGVPQHFVVGDTYPLGCKFSEKIVFSEQLVANPDTKVPKYSSTFGMYKPNCGLDNVQMSWGHDEYMYQVLIGNGCKIPNEGLYMIRYHSFYPWHCEGEYDHLCSDKDRTMLPWIKEFNRFDLYSKADSLPDVKKIRPYYQSLIDKFCPGTLKW